MLLCLRACVAAQPLLAALEQSGHPLATHPHPTILPRVPADKCCATRVDIIVGLCGSRWPGNSVWKQEELPSLE